MRLLILEDDDSFGAAIEYGHTRAGDAVNRIRNGVERSLHAQTDRP